MTAILILALALAQHAVISARAGFLTYSEGAVNALPAEHLGVDNTLATGPSGRVEMMLTPDSYVRLVPFSSLRLDAEELDRIEVVLIEGSAIFDIREIDSDFPIRVRRGDGMEISIGKRGVYLFEPDRVSVLDGELEINHDGERLKKGWSLVEREGSIDREPSGDDVENHIAVQWNDVRIEALKPERPLRRFRSYRF